MNTKRTSLFLMANLGAEVTRLLSARENGDTELMEGAYDRADKILYEIRKSSEMQSRKEELSILAQVLKDYTELKPKFSVSSKSIKSYFIPFSLRLMNQS